MSERKVGDRQVAILVGIICILAVGLVGDIVVNTKLNAQVEDLRGQVHHLQNMVYLECSDDWAKNQTVSQRANSYSSWKNSAWYCGILGVEVVSSTTNTTYVEVIYDDGFSYDRKVEVGSSGYVRFPIAPTWVEVRVGNTDLTSGATETVTIVYYY